MQILFFLKSDKSFFISNAILTCVNNKSIIIMLSNSNYNKRNVDMKDYIMFYLEEFIIKTAENINIYLCDNLLLSLFELMKYLK